MSQKLKSEWGWRSRVINTGLIWMVVLKWSLHALCEPLWKYSVQFAIRSGKEEISDLASYRPFFRRNADDVVALVTRYTDSNEKPRIKGNCNLKGSQAYPIQLLH